MDVNNSIYCRELRAFLLESSGVSVSENDDIHYLYTLQILYT